VSSWFSELLHKIPRNFSRSDFFAKQQLHQAHIFFYLCFNQSVIDQFVGQSIFVRSRQTIANFYEVCITEQQSGFV